MATRCPTRRSAPTAVAPSNGPAAAVWRSESVPDARTTGPPSPANRRDGAGRRVPRWPRIGTRRREVMDMGFLSGRDREKCGHEGDVRDRRRRVTGTARRTSTNREPGSRHVDVSPEPASACVCSGDGGGVARSGRRPGSRGRRGARRRRPLRPGGRLTDPARPVLRRRQDRGRGPGAGGLHPVRAQRRAASATGPRRRRTCVRSSSTSPATTTAAASSRGATGPRHSPTPRRPPRRPRSGPSGPRSSTPCAPSPAASGTA